MELEEWDIEDYKLIYFSDESLMCCKKQGIKWIRKPRNQPYT